MSEDGGEEADDGLEGALPPGTAMPFGVDKLAALLQVGEENVAHLAVDRPVVNEKMCLKIILEATEVKIA